VIILNKQIKKCSKCNSNNVIGPNPLFDAKLGLGKYNEKRFGVVAYICLDCFYVEFYVDKKSTLRINELIEQGIMEIG
jgi:hypothetical protein